MKKVNIPCKALILTSIFFISSLSHATTHTILENCANVDCKSSPLQACKDAIAKTAYTNCTPTGTPTISKKFGESGGSYVDCTCLENSN